MIGDGGAVLADHDATGIGLDLHRAADGAGGNRVLVVVEANQAGLRHRGRRGMEAVEPAGDRDEVRPLALERLPDRQPRDLRMLVHLGIGDALVEASRSTPRSSSPGAGA